LRLATREADGGSVYGFKPSSLLTLFTSLIGVVAAIMMPIVGAVVDHTSHRRLMGVLSGVLSVAFIGGQIAISQDNWFTMLLIDACQTLVYLVHTTSVFAYLPDLSLDQNVIAKYTSQFNIRQYCGQFTFVSLVVICGEIRGTDRTIESTVQTAKDAAGIAFAFGALFIGYAWIFLFRDRPALSKVPEGSNLITTGFKQVSRTAKVILAEYRSLKWFMLSLLWSPEAGAGVVLSIAVTFLTVSIKLTGQEIAITSLLLMIGNLFGSLVSRKMCALVNPLNSYRMGLSFLAAAISCSFLYLTGPRKVGETYLTGLVWGAAMGWTYPSQRVLFCTLIPKGQETEMMGLFVFVGQILGWLPSLIFTIMNEKGIPLEYGLALVGGFCALAVLFTLPMGSYENACRQAAEDSESKLNAVVHATAHHLAITSDDKEKAKAATVDEESAPKMSEDGQISEEDVLCYKFSSSEIVLIREKAEVALRQLRHSIDDAVCFEDYGFVKRSQFCTPAECQAMKAKMHALVENEWDPAVELDSFGTDEKANTARGDYFLESADKIHYFTEPEALELTADGKQILKPDYDGVNRMKALNKVGHAMHIPADSPFGVYFRSSKLSQLVKDDLGWKNPVVPQSMYIFKQAHNGGAVNSHQDSTFLFTAPRQTCLGLWLALDDATIENGCLWIRPASHKEGVRRQYCRNPLHFGNDSIEKRSNECKGDKDAQKFVMNQLDGEPSVPWEGELPESGWQGLFDAGFIPVECKAGDLLAFSGTVDHLSLPNYSDKARHTFQLHLVEGPQAGIEWSKSNWLQYPEGKPFKEM
jgi:phytanoyl-CoA hydroxylase